MRISTKLYVTVGALAMVGTVAAGLAVLYLRMACTELRLTAEKTSVKIDLVNADRARAWEMAAVLYQMEDSAKAGKQTEVEQLIRQWEFAFKRATENLKVIQPLLSTEEGKTALGRFETALSDFKSVSTQYFRLCRGGSVSQTAELRPKMRQFEVVSDETLGEIRDHQRRFMKDSQARAKELEATSLAINVSMGCMLVGIAIGAIWIVRGINSSLATAIGEIFQGAEQVAAAAVQVSSASESLAQGASEQAASIEETSASTEEINSMAQKTSEGFAEAASLVTSSQQKFVETGAALEQTVAAMGDINAQSGKISKIIRTIDEIAFQTNILALNAAVEAARAGESGKSFAVVADEVRNLAQRCAQAARDTTALIEESIVKAKDGNLKVDQVATAIRSIAEESAKVKTIVDDVNIGSQQQVRGIEQIGKAMVQMERVVQGTAATAEQSAAASEQLSRQSTVLKEIVQRLRGMVMADGDRHVEFDAAA